MINYNTLNSEHMSEQVMVFLEIWKCYWYVTVYNVVFQGMIPCFLVGRYQRFGETFCFHVQGSIVYGKEPVELYRQIARKVAPLTQGAGEGMETSSDQ